MRHSLINDIIHRALVKAKIPANKEPQGLLVGSALRPDGVTLIPWSQGKCLTWDATTPDTLAQSHVPSTSVLAGAAASQASALKVQKYSALLASYHVIPIAIETLGPFNDEGTKFIHDLGKKIAAVTGDPRETLFLKQRLSLAVQRGNAISCRGTLPVFEF
jgi:hypothetical protein